MMLNHRAILEAIRNAKAGRRRVAFENRPKTGAGADLITRDRPIVPFEDRPRHALAPAWRRSRYLDEPALSGIEGTAAILGAGTLTNLATASSSSGGGWSWLTNLIQGGVQAWGTAKIEQMRQKNLIETYGTNRTIQAMSALDYQRALEARQRGLELDRSLGVTSPLMTGATPWILGGVALLGLVMLTRKK
jgi:hypothetical protein